MRTQQTTQFLPRSPDLLAVLWSVGALCLLCGTARAQEVPATPKPPVFPMLFQNPMGMNAYEDWVYAGDLVQNNQVAEEVLAEGASLTLKRRLCNDRIVQQALLTLHTSLDKPVQPPRTVIDENTRFLEFANFRKLARLLDTQIYVDFADGRVDAAMEALSDGLRFGNKMQSDTLIISLVGIAVETIVLKGFAPHLDQLSEYQCRRLQRIVEDQLEAPSPAFAVLAHESLSAQRTLDAKRNDLAGLEEMITQSYSGEEGLSPDAQVFLDHLKTHPGDLGPALDHAKTLIAAHYELALANLKLPVKERRPLPDNKDKSLGGRIFDVVTPSFDVVAYRFDRMDAMVRLLGVHAAIRRYKWEHNFLPNSLAELHLGALNTDPYTDKGFLYKRDGDVYDLSSFGPAERGSQEHSAAVPANPVRL